MSGRSEIVSLPASPRRGSSTLMTFAPCHASASVQEGPASNWVRSTTVSPDSGASVMTVLLERIGSAPAAKRGTFVQSITPIFHGRRGGRPPPVRIRSDRRLIARSIARSPCRGTRIAARSRIGAPVTTGLGPEGRESRRERRERRDADHQGGNVRADHQRDG